MATIVEHIIQPIVYHNSDIKRVQQLYINFNSGDPDLLILPAIEKQSIVLLGMRYKAISAGNICFKTDSQTIIEEYYAIGDAYGRSPSEGFLFSVPSNKALYYNSDGDSKLLLFVGYYNSLGLNK